MDLKNFFGDNIGPVGGIFTNMMLNKEEEPAEPTTPTVDVDLSKFNSERELFAKQLDSMRLANQTQFAQMKSLYETSMEQMMVQMKAQANPIIPDQKRPRIKLGDSRSLKTMALGS